ncbi:DUF1427 family protein [Burkholderia sp. Ac-20379]|uniref:DUF1427 family protein n=1 Tax=Burkholderia sp. Ac-20379 TaxID=2703900 RepID=UPI00197F6903|nr:DUF1427 family protein [Burkholderia sp. Ac-20379]MBN3724698.1 XapX domain-containing protein [Burkholderia sp. Ac-20379]
MKPYLLSLCAGVLVGLIYSLLGVRSPAPPAIALLGLLGILAGEAAMPGVLAVLQRMHGKPETPLSVGTPKYRETPAARMHADSGERAPDSERNHGSSL